MKDEILADELATTAAQLVYKDGESCCTENCPRTMTCFGVMDIINWREIVKVSEEG